MANPGNAISTPAICSVISRRSSSTENELELEERRPLPFLRPFDLSRIILWRDSRLMFVRVMFVVVTLTLMKLPVNGLTRIVIYLMGSRLINYLMSPRLIRTN